MPRRVLGAKDSKMKKTKKSQPSLNLHFSSEGQAANQQTNILCEVLTSAIRTNQEKALSERTRKRRPEGSTVVMPVNA